MTLQRSAEPDFARQVRVALHTGEARLRDDGRYTGATLRRGQRLRDIGNGGQALMSALRASLAQDPLHGLRGSYPDSLDALAALAASGGQAEHAARLLAAADRARRGLSAPRARVDRLAHETLLERLRATSGFADAWAAGGELDADSAVGYARRSRGTRDRRRPAGPASHLPSATSSGSPSRASATRRSERACS